MVVKIKYMDICSKKCMSRCCKYVSIEIDTPVSVNDFEQIYWILCHKDTAVFIDNKVWHLYIENECGYLNKKTNLCENYDKRPKICIEYDVRDCEYKDPPEFDYFFSHPDDLFKYIKKKYKNKFKKYLKKYLKK